MPDWHVIVNEDGAVDGEWTLRGPFDVDTGDAAIEAVRDAIPELKMNKRALFQALKLKPKRMRRKLVATYVLDDATVPDDDPQQVLADA